MSKKQNNSEYVNKFGDNDLFEGQLAKAAVAALSEEDKERYKKIGEELYGTIDFESNQPKSTMSDDMIEALACIEIQLNSGLHPSDLESNEKELLKDAYGDEWFKKWDYELADLTKIVTLKR
tara:strand:- start:121 stop:486 length:366 start_codon:yes stop_codon:yes gene_type:complete